VSAEASRTYGRTVHSHQTRVHWDGTTAVGTRSYSRDHTALAPLANSLCILVEVATPVVAA